MVKQRKQKTSSRLSRLGRGLIIAVVGLVTVPTMVQAWTEPLSPPGQYSSDPQGLRDTLKFLNPSSATQQKKGTLIIGAAQDQAKLCLNSDPNFPAHDPDNCISAWGTLQNQPYLRLGTNDGGQTLSQYNSYTSGPLISVKNDVSAGQLYGVIAEANRGTGLPGPAVGLTAFSNIPGGSPSDFNYAGYLSGSVLIGTNDWNSTKQLCLNHPTATADIITTGSNSKGCISRWSDLYFANGGQGYIQLTTPGVVANRQNGRIRITDTAQTGALVVGNPAGLPLAYTCGDGLCSNNTSPAETSSSCSIDCSGSFLIGQSGPVNIALGSQ